MILCHITMTAEQKQGDQGTLGHQTSKSQFIIHATNNNFGSERQ